MKKEILLPTVGTLSIYGFLPKVWQSCYKRNNRTTAFDEWMTMVDPESCEITLVAFCESEKTIVTNRPMCLKQIVDALNDFNVERWNEGIEDTTVCPYIPDATYHSIVYDTETKKASLESDS